MSKPQVTITLGRSGQKVVKRPQPMLYGPRADFQPLSGSKRSFVGRFESDSHSSFLSMNKRSCGDVISSKPNHSRMDGKGIGRNDLRFKLMHKRLSRRANYEVDESNKMDSYKNIPRPVRSLERFNEKISRSFRSPERSLLRGTHQTESAGHLQWVNSRREPYSSLNKGGLRNRSPDRVSRASRGISPPRYNDELQRGPSTRAIHTSTTGSILSNCVMDPSGPLRPTLSRVRSNLDAANSVMGFPSACGSAPKSSYIEQPLTVGSLLHSLGLGKYVVLFQAEEIDMAALKQMGDRDLKELGIPMGPRKKIVLALEPRSKWKPQQ